MSLKARLTGEVAFRFGSTEVRPQSRKGVALLAYLCLRPEGERRAELAELLWGRGRLANLRQELYALRQLPGATEWLTEHDDTVRVLAEVDDPSLTAALRSGDPHVRRDTLLPGLERSMPPAYVEWLEAERSRAVDTWSKAARASAVAAADEGRLAEALALLDALLAEDPLDETSARTAMTIAAELGDREGALRRFDDLVVTLRTELGVSPTQPTADLAKAVAAGEALPSLRDPARLEAGVKAVLQVLAVADGDLGVEGVARVVDRGMLDVASDLARLERAGWLRGRLDLEPEDRKVVLASSTQVVIRLLHQRVADVLAGEEPTRSERVARHRLFAHQPAKAAGHLADAARSAAKEGRLADAARLAQLAMLAAFEQPADRLEAALLLEGCAGQLGDDGLQDSALSTAESLAFELQSDRQLAEVKMRRSRSCLRRGRTAEGLEYALEALATAVRLEDLHLQARARNAVGGAQFYAGDVAGAEISFSANADAPDQLERFRALNNLGSIAGVTGRQREAIAHLEEALTLGRAMGERAALVGILNNLAATAERVGDYRRAVKYLKESLSLARSAGSAAHEGQVLVNLAVVYTRLGELGPAWNTAQEVEEIAVERGEPRLLMLAHEQRAEICQLCGADAEAAQWLSRAAELATELGDERKCAALAAGRAVLAARTGAGSFESAEEVVGSGDPRLSDVVSWLWLDLALATGDPEGAGRYVSRAREASAGGPHLEYMVRLATLRAALLPRSAAAARSAAKTALTSTSDEAASAHLRFAQTPLMTLLAKRAEGAAVTPTEVVAALEEQSAGLPSRLKTSLLARPDAWTAGLAASLTLD